MKEYALLVLTVLFHHYRHDRYQALIVAPVDTSIYLLSRGGGGVLIYFSVRGRAAEQGIIFRILTPEQGIIFVKISSMTGSIFVIFDSERPF